MLTKWQQYCTDRLVRQDLLLNVIWVERNTERPPFPRCTYIHTVYIQYCYQYFSSTTAYFLFHSSLSSGLQHRMPLVILSTVEQHNWSWAQIDYSYVYISCKPQVHQSSPPVQSSDCILPCITILDSMQLLTCMQVTAAINAAKLQLCVLKQNSRSRLCTQKT